MPLTKATVTRTDDTTGDSFLTFDDGTGRKAQGVSLVDESGDHAGISTNPAFVDTPARSTTYSSSTAENEAQVDTGSGVLREINVILHDTVTSPRYLMLFDRSTALSGGETPLVRAYIPAGGAASLVFTGGKTYSTGVRVAVSTTLATFTDPATSEAVFYVEAD